MGKRKHNKHANKSSQAEEKQSPREQQHKKVELRAAIAHALSSGWVQNSGILFLGALIGLIVAMYFSKEVKAAAITFALVGTVFLWIIAVVVIRYSSESNPPQLAFSLLFKNFDGSRNPTSGVFWYRYQSGYGDTLSPASAALYITLKNLRPSPVYIERLEISVQKKGEKWLPLRHIPADGGRMYWIYGDITKASLLNMPTLDQRIHSSIPAGETVPGWVFLAATKGYPVSEGELLRWRLRTRDSAGVECEYVSLYDVVNNRPEFDTAATQPVPIVVAGVKEDLSKLVVRNYEPLPYK